MYLIVLYSSGVVQTVMLRWRGRGGAGQCGHSGHWTTRKQDFFWNWISPKAAVLVSGVARTGGCSSLYLYEGKLGELTRADRQQDNSAGDTADSAH